MLQGFFYVQHICVYVMFVLRGNPFHIYLTATEFNRAAFLPFLKRYMSFGENILNLIQNQLSYTHMCTYIKPACIFASKKESYSQKQFLFLILLNDPDCFGFQCNNKNSSL